MPRKDSRFEPGVRPDPRRSSQKAIGGTDIPRGYLGKLQKAPDGRDIVTAVSFVGAAANPDEIPKNIPLWLQRSLTVAFLKSTHGQRVLALIRTVRPKIGRILENEEPDSFYPDITAKVLLGTESHSSSYFNQACDALLTKLVHGQ